MCLPSSDPGLLRSGDDFQIWSNLSGARGQWLRRALNLDKAHSAVSSDRETLVIAKSGNFDTIIIGALVTTFAFTYPASVQA